MTSLQWSCWNFLLIQSIVGFCMMYVVLLIDLLKQDLKRSKQQGNTAKYSRYSQELPKYCRNWRKEKKMWKKQFYVKMRQRQFYDKFDKFTNSNISWVVRASLRSKMSIDIIERLKKYLKLLKDSKSQKHNILFSFLLNNERNSFLNSALEARAEWFRSFF